MALPLLSYLTVKNWTVGSLAVALLTTFFGLHGYIIAIIILTPGYQLFQAGNNTVVMMNVRDAKRGVVSGMLNLSRNIGLITGASAIGAVFAITSENFSLLVITENINRIFIVASLLMIVSLGLVARNNFNQE